MKMFSDCSGKCEDCAIDYYGGCLAGHGDDDFIPMTEIRAIEFIKKYKNNKSYIIIIKINDLLSKFPNIKIT